LFPQPKAPGWGSFVFEQVRALRARGVDARVLCGVPQWVRSSNPVKFLLAFFAYAAHARRSEWHELDGVPVLYFPFPILYPQFAYASAYRWGFRITVRRVRSDFDFECIHAHTAWLDGAAGRWASRRWKVPLLLTEHTGPFQSLLRHPLMRHEVRRSVSTADVTFAVSHFLANEMRSSLGSQTFRRLQVLPNGVDGRLFQAASAPPQETRIVFVGYFEPVKNLPVLLDAFARLLRRRPDVRLLLVGGGSEEPRLRAQSQSLGIEARVEFRGYQSREEIARILREETTVLVLPSATETFGCVLVEALASGRPVVATRCGGPEDIVVDETLGRLCQPGDPRALEGAIADVLEKYADFQATRLRESALERFDYRIIAERLHREYCKLLSGPSAQSLALSAGATP
jgi:glycosyltransferase involved in cell wall biosynthesis